MRVFNRRNEKVKKRHTKPRAAPSGKKEPRTKPSTQPKAPRASQVQQTAPSRRGTKPLPELQRMCDALGIELKRVALGDGGRTVWSYRVPEFHAVGLPDAYKDTWGAFASLSEYCMGRGRVDVRAHVAYDGALFEPTDPKGDPKLSMTQEEAVRWMIIDSD